jgi:uncharacterized protein (DUF433 family)
VSTDRFSAPLYGIAEAAAYLDVPSSTVATWAYGYERRRPGAGVVVGRPVITAIRPARRHGAAMPFIGLAEAYALAAFRQAGVPMQRIRPAIDALHQELGLQYALASRRLYTDGAEILYDYAQHAEGTPEGESARELVIVRNNQRVFAEVVARYLQRVDFAPDGYAQVIHLPQYRVAEVTIDPDHGFGRPRFARGGAGLEDVIDLFRAGEPVDAVAAEFGLSRDEVEDALRANTRTAATEAARDFSDLLDAVERGETVTITRGHNAVAEMRPARCRTGAVLRAALENVPPPDDRFAADIADALAPVRMT